MAIILQSSVGGFSDEFMRKLPLVERAMVDRGLDPSDFVISKDLASPSAPYATGPFFYQYTVSFVSEARGAYSPHSRASVASAQPSQ